MRGNAHPHKEHVMTDVTVQQPPKWQLKTLRRQGQKYLAAAAVLAVVLFATAITLGAFNQ
jgi:hypothetical protein